MWYFFEISSTNSVKDSVLPWDSRTVNIFVILTSLLKHINSVNDAYGETVLKHIVNVEQVPAENVAVKLASMDRLQGLNDKYKIYANQFIPLVTETEGGILERISIQGELDEHFYQRLNATLSELDTCMQAMIQGRR